MESKLLSKIDFKNVRELYDMRMNMHHRIEAEFKKGNIEQYTKLALGITENCGNYSAAEHGLGPKILLETTTLRVFNLAKQLYECRMPKEIPDIILRAAIQYLKISVGSEMAAMLRPDTFWVTNTRTIWATLLVKHADDVGKANLELQLYRDGERDSEMDYRIWSDIHGKLDVSLTRLAKLGKGEAIAQKVKPGDLVYLWADAVANALYESR